MADHKEEMRKETDSALLDFVTVVSMDRNMSPGEYIKEATLEALADSLNTTSNFLRKLDISPTEELELLKSVSERDGILVSSYIREAVAKAVARDLRTFEDKLMESLQCAESWTSCS